MERTADIIESDSESCYVPLLAFLVRIAASISVSLQYINRKKASAAHLVSKMVLTAKYQLGSAQSAMMLVLSECS